MDMISDNLEPEHNIHEIKVYKIYQTLANYTLQNHFAMMDKSTNGAVTRVQIL